MWMCKECRNALCVRKGVNMSGPALAMDTVKGRSCRRLGWNSSWNSPPQMLSPPVPSPSGSPVWIMKDLMTCAHGGQLNWVARKKSAAKVDLRTVEDAMENEAVVVAVARVRAKVFDGLRALVPEEPEADVAHGRPERRLHAEQGGPLTGGSARARAGLFCKA